MFLKIIISLISSIGISSMFGSIRNEIESIGNDIKNNIKKAAIVIVAALILISVVPIVLIYKGYEALQSEMQTLLIKANDEARAEREAWQSEMQALLVGANDEARAEREAWQSEMQTFTWVMFGMTFVFFSVVIATLVVFGIAHRRRLKNRISELEWKLDDLLPAPRKKIQQLHILADPDSQDARRVEGSPAGASTESPSFPRK